ncbi:MAG TPA: hypothetical protein PLM90_12620, partial [Chitinophagales bacterium]|nr:hypothetical protein [Chitinophagales bacterium]
NGDTDDGLEIKCNTFEEGKYDISLISGATTATMKKNQGACGTLTSPANNLFTDPSFADINTQIKTSSDITTTNYYKFSFHEDDDAGGSPFAAPAIYSNTIDPLPDGDVFESGCNDVETFTTTNLDDYCSTNFPSGSGGSGRMSAPKATKRRPPTLMMPLTYNPYEYLKPAGVDYEGFLKNIRFNMEASYYLQNELIDSLNILLNEYESPLATSIKVQLLEDLSDYDNAEVLSAELTESPDAELNGYNSSLLSLGLSLSRDTLTWLQTTEEQFSSIKTEAQRNDREGIQAKLLMELIAGGAYIEPINELNEELTTEELRLLQQSMPQSKPNSIQVYPHPVGSGSVVEINLKSIQSNARFIITDVQGRNVLQFPLDNLVSYVKLDNTLLRPGVYIGYVAGATGEQISKQIVVIQ